MTMDAIQGEIGTGTEIDNDQPYLNTLLVSRQVFSEAAPIFYSQNCFVFGSSQSLNLCGSTALLPAYTFLRDRREPILGWIKRIELQFIGNLHDAHRLLQPPSYPLSDTSFADSEQPLIAQLLFPFIKANLSLDFLGLSFAGWCTAHKLPDREVFDSPQASTLAHLCNLGKVGRLAIKYANETYLLKVPDGDTENPRRYDVHTGHGRQCFAQNVMLDDGHFSPGRYLDINLDQFDGCSIARESFRVAAFARLLRHHVLENGDQRAYQHIRVVMGVDDWDARYIELETDDDKTGKSYLEEEQRQETSMYGDLTKFDPFASAGGSAALDEVQPHGWSPQWAVGQQSGAVQ